MYVEEPITVVLASDSFLIGDGLESILAGIVDVQVVGKVRDVGHLTQSIEDIRPNAVLISVRSQVVTTAAIVAAARQLRFSYPDMGIVVISDRCTASPSSSFGWTQGDRLPLRRAAPRRWGCDRCTAGVANGRHCSGSEHRGNPHPPNRRSGDRGLDAQGVGHPRADGARSVQPRHRRGTTHLGQVHREGRHGDLLEAGSVQSRIFRPASLRGPHLPALPNRPVRVRSCPVGTGVARCPTQIRRHAGSAVVEGDVTGSARADGRDLSTHT